jgi:hypothetical protein
MFEEAQILFPNYFKASGTTWEFLLEDISQN